MKKLGHRITAIVCIGSLLSCKTTQEFTKKSAYKPTRVALKQGQLKKAQTVYPAKRLETFVPVLEQAWLSLLNDKVDTDKLIRWSQYIEDAGTVYVSDEAKRFFFKEIDEHYHPAEHETVMFHLIAGLGFAKKGLYKKVCIEAKRASRYLPGALLEKSDFDDAGMRLILASLWMICGEWQQARANLKRAGRIDKKFDWAAAVSRRKRQPENFVLALSGVGPEVFWRPNDKKSKRWGLVFIDKPPEALSLRVDSEVFKIPEPSATDHWYTRHFYRNSLPRTFIDNTAYYTKVGLGTGIGVMAASIVIVGGVTVFVLSLGVSTALVGAGIAYGSSDLVELGFKVGAEIVPVSVELAGDAIKAGSNFAEKSYDQNADQSENYRFVRFLPSYIYATSFDGKFKDLKIGQSRPLINVKRGDRRVSIFYLP